MAFILEGSLQHLSFQIGYRSEDPHNPHEIYGLRLGVYNSNASEDHFTGLEAGLVNHEAGEINGLAIGLYNSARRFEGTSLGFMNNALESMIGFNLGLVNSVDEGQMVGLQVSAWNSAKEDMIGFQVGVLLNTANRMYGFQAGIMNMASNLWEGGIQLLIPIWTDPPPLIEP